MLDLLWNFFWLGSEDVHISWDWLGNLRDLVYFHHVFVSEEWDDWSLEPVNMEVEFVFLLATERGPSFEHVHQGLLKSRFGFGYFSLWSELSKSYQLINRRKQCLDVRNLLSFKCQFHIFGLLRFDLFLHYWFRFLRCLFDWGLNLFI